MNLTLHHIVPTFNDPEREDCLLCSSNRTIDLYFWFPLVYLQQAVTSIWISQHYTDKMCTSIFDLSWVKFTTWLLLILKHIRFHFIQLITYKLILFRNIHKGTCSFTDHRSADTVYVGLHLPRPQHKHRRRGHKHHRRPAQHTNEDLAMTDGRFYILGLLFLAHLSTKCSEWAIVLRSPCVVNFLPCVYSRRHIFSSIIMKLGQNFCLDEVSEEFENGSFGVKN